MTRDSYINRHSLASLPDYFVFNYPLFKAFFLRELVTINRIPIAFILNYLILLVITTNFIIIILINFCFVYFF